MCVDMRRVWRWIGDGAEVERNAETMYYARATHDGCAHMMMMLLPTEAAVGQRENGYVWNIEHEHFEEHVCKVYVFKIGDLWRTGFERHRHNR